MVRRLRYLAAHPLDAVVVLLWMSAVEFAVRLVPVSKLANLLGAPLATQPTEPGVAAQPRLNATDVRRLRLLDALARRWPFGSGPCLRQALVAGRLLRRHGPRLRIGAALDHDDLVGHAWVEVGSLEIGHSSDFTMLLSSSGS